MGLEDKIKQDNESMRRQRVDKNEKLKGIIKSTNTIATDKVNFTLVDKSKPFKRHRGSVETVDDDGRP